MRVIFAPMLLALLFTQNADADASSDRGSTGITTALPPVDAQCSLSLGGGVVDYGTLSRWQLQDAQAGQNNVTFGKRTLTLSVACPYTQSMRLTLRGEPSARGDFRYGNRGSMSVRLFDAQIDGKSVLISGTTPDGIINSAAGDSRRLRPGDNFAATVNGQLAKGKTFTARLEIDPTLPEADAQVSTHQLIEAKLTMDLMN